MTDAIEWEARFATGVEILDSQHARLFAGPEEKEAQ